MTFDERLRAVATHGFTARQAAFLTTVMLHAGVCVQRQYRAFAGIAQGQVVRDFFKRLTTGRLATAHPCGPRGGHLFHIHHKALYRAIGEPDSRYRRRGSLTRAIERLMVLDATLLRPEVTWLATEREKVAHFVHVRGLGTEDLPAVTFEAPTSRTTRYFPHKLPLGLASSGDEVMLLYLTTKPTGRAFRTFLAQHERLLLRLPRWRVLLVFPAPLARAEAAHRGTFREWCGAPLRPAVVEEFQWFCGVRRAMEQHHTVAAHADAARFARARRAFGAPRFYAAYRQWCRQGDASLHRLLSPALHEASQRGAIIVETTVLPYVYGELGPVAHRV